MIFDRLDKARRLQMIDYRLSMFYPPDSGTPKPRGLRPPTPASHGLRRPGSGGRNPESGIRADPFLLLFIAADDSARNPPGSSSSRASTL